MQKHWKLFTTSLIVTLTLASPQAIQGMEEHKGAGGQRPFSGNVQAIR